MNQIEHLSRVMDFVYDKLQQPKADEFEQADEQIEEQDYDEHNLIKAIEAMSRWGWKPNDVLKLAETLNVKGVGDETP